jgi:hypothetical protein
MIGKARLWVLSAVMLACVACHADSGSSAPPAVAQQPPADSAPPAEAAKEDDVFSRARGAIAQYQLTSVPVTCLKLAIDNTSAELYELTVYELHNDQCGGDPQTQPRLFSLQLSRTDAKIWTDARSDDGELELLTQ